MNVRSQPAAALAAQLGDELWLAASPTRAWLSHTAPDTTQIISVPAVRSLLDGAMAAALLPNAPRLASNRPLTPIRWLWWLVGDFHLTHWTAELLEFAAERFAAAEQRALADWARARAQLHEQRSRLMLEELQAMHIDPTRALAAMRPHPAERLVAWLRACVLAVDPIGCVGYVHAVERLALELGSNHVDETLELLTRLSATRCEAVARAVFDVASLCATLPAETCPEDAAIAHRLVESGEAQVQQSG